jgi:outer membrane protein
MTSLLEETDKQMREISTKLNDQEYMESLSKEAQEELANKFRNLNEEMNRYQNQYYQVLNQANMRFLQNLHTQIQEAASAVAANEKLDMVINKEAFFYHQNQFEVTEKVIEEMNRKFDLEQVANVENADKKTQE